MRQWFAVAAAAFMLAGCAQSPTSGQDPEPPVETDVYDAVRAIMADVPCTVPSVGAETTANLLQLANATLADDEGGNIGAGDIDVRGHLLASGAGLMDVSDPLRPRQVVRWGDHIENAGGGDIKFLPDNVTVVTGGDAVRLIDITDPRNPAVTDTWEFSEFGGLIPPIDPLFLNAHMLYTARIAGKDWVFVAPNNNNGVWILEVQGEPGAHTLAYASQTLPIEGGPLGPHDMFVQEDPIDGNWYLYAADGWHGWIVFNVNDPANPLPVGGAIRPETGYTHTIQAAQIGDRRIVATIQEVGPNFLEVYDATNLAAPVLLATWQVAPGSTTPQHNINIVNGTLYMAHYGYGMFVFDLADAGALPLAGTTTLQPVAHYDPAPGGDPYIVGIGGFEAVYDVVLRDGLLYVSGFSDPVVGVHVVGYGCNPVGDPTYVSVG